MTKLNGKIPDYSTFIEHNEFPSEETLKMFEAARPVLIDKYKGKIIYFGTGGKIKNNESFIKLFKNK